MGCSLIPSLSYGELSESLHKEAVEKRIPISGGFELTYRCNLRCVHCYVEGEGNVQKELSFEEICAILDEMANEGCLWLLITGGEPLIRKDFLDIYLYAKKKGFIITLFTNGTLINLDVIECFLEWPPFKVEITVYGASQETYEKVTQVPRSYDKCMSGINLLVENDIALQLKSMIMTLNKHEVRELKNLSKSLGMPFMFDPILSPKLNRSLEPRLYSLSSEEIVGLDLEDPQRLQEWKEYLKTSLQKPKSDSLYRCAAGQTTFFISPYGELQLCVISRTPSYNLKTGSFKVGWYDFFRNICQQKVREDFKCKECELVSICGQCPGWSYLEHGNYDTPVEYLCEIAHQRAEEFRKKGVIA